MENQRRRGESKELPVKRFQTWLLVESSRLKSLKQKQKQLQRYFFDFLNSAISLDWRSLWKERWLPLSVWVPTSLNVGRLFLGVDWPLCKGKGGIARLLLWLNWSKGETVSISKIGVLLDCSDTVAVSSWLLFSLGASISYLRLEAVYLQTNLARTSLVLARTSAQRVKLIKSKNPTQ